MKILIHGALADATGASAITWHGPEPQRQDLLRFCGRLYRVTERFWTSVGLDAPKETTTMTMELNLATELEF